MDIATVSRTGAILSVLLSALLLAAAVLGPLVMDRIRFHMSADALVQYVGGELVTLLIAVALLVSAPAWWTGHDLSPAFGAGAAAYVLYTVATVVAGQEYDRYPGNVEKYFLLYVAITAAAVVLLATSVRALSSTGALTGPRQLTGWVLIGIGVVVALLWLGQLAGFYRSGPTEEYQTATSLFWLIKYLDLGVVIPSAILIGLLQWVPSTGADAAAVTMLGFLTLLFAALLLMAVEMLRRDTPGASWSVAVGAAVLLALTAYAWLRWLPPLRQ